MPGMRRKNWKQMITRLLKPVPPEDAWIFLRDFAFLLYDLDVTKVLRTEQLAGQDWRAAIYQIAYTHPHLDGFCSPLDHVNPSCAKTAAELLQVLCEEPETLHENTAAIFHEALRQVADLRSSRDFITPAQLANLMVSMLDPKQEECILDPVCGSGGLLTACASLHRDGRFFGMDIHPTFAAITYFNLHFHGVTSQKISAGDLLEYADQTQDVFDVVLANPPYASDLPQTIRFLTSILKVMKSGGRCGVLVPEGLLSNTATSKVVEFKKWLLRCHTLEAVVSLPPKIYRPYTESKSSLLLLRNGTVNAGRPVFFTELPEFKGAEIDFSPTVYQADMERIAKAWKLYAGNQMYRDPLFQTVTAEELRQNGYDLSVKARSPSAYAAGSTPVKQWRKQLSQRQDTLERLLLDYMGEEP